jgi:hypothetical protein
MNSSLNRGISNVVEGRHWRFVVSVEHFKRRWFPIGSGVHVIYHYNPDTNILRVHFLDFLSRMVLAPGGVHSLARELGGRVVGDSIQLKDLENQESARIFSEYLQEFFEENRSLSKKSLCTA